MSRAPSSQVGRGAISLWREILPNVLPTIVALLTLEMGIAVIVEAILSFVNLSISTDSADLGRNDRRGPHLDTTRPGGCWSFPLAVLFLTVLSSFSQFGEGLKDRFDPVLR